MDLGIVKTSSNLKLVRNVGTGKCSYKTFLVSVILVMFNYYISQHQIVHGAPGKEKGYI